MLDVPVTEIEAELVPATPLRLDPRIWWANALRGALGATLRFMLCQKRQTPCADCSERPSCDFVRFFQPERYPEPAARGPRYRAAPWILHARVTDTSLRVLCRLFGPATSEAWRWVMALELAAARGVGPRRPAFRFRAPATVRAGTLATFAPPAPDPSRPLLVHFRSPLRLLHDGTPHTGPPAFETFLSAAHRRLRLAALYWADGVSLDLASPRVPPCQVPTLDHGVAWLDFPRYSSRQERAMRLGGIVGHVRYGEGWYDSWPVLATAAVLHLGKLTTMGFGAIEFGPG